MPALRSKSFGFRMVMALWTCRPTGSPRRLHKFFGCCLVWRVACTIIGYKHCNWDEGGISRWQFYLHYESTVANNIRAKHVSKTFLRATMH